MTTKTRNLLSDIQWIVLVVSTAIIIGVAGVSLIVVSHTMLAELRARSLATANEMQALLEYPLYVVDDHQAARIAETFLASNKISGIILESSANGVLLSKTTGAASTRIAKISRDIARSGMSLGKFTITFSDEEITRTQKRFAVIAVAIVVALLLANWAANRYLIAPRVRRPFDSIGAAIENISAGNFQTPADPTPYRDVNVLVDLINAMAAKIHMKNEEQKRAEARQTSRLHRIQKQQSALIELAQNESISRGDFETSAAFIVQTASDVVGVARTSVWLLSDDRAQLHCIDLFDRAAGRHQSGAVLGARDFPRYFDALTTGRTIAANDAETDGRTIEFANSYLIPLGITSMLDATVRFEGKVIGVICFEHVGQQRVWQEDEIAFAAACADCLAVTQANRQRAQAEQSLRESERKARAIFDLAFGFVGLLTPDGRLVEANRTALDFAGVELADVVGQPFWETPWWRHSAAMQDQLRQAVRTAADGQTARFEASHLDRDGQEHVIDFSLKPVGDEGGRVVLLIPEGRDITERKRAEQEKASMQQHLLQVQKMEAIGELTGGIAHDFNNMLSVVIGHTEMAMINLDADDPMRQRLHAIYQAGQRTAGLVRQLLGFARRQTVSPVVIDLNLAISDLLKMLQRIIGEDIDLAWRPGRDLGRVKIDPSQLDQILANLAVNARDAIAGVGSKITIETQNVDIDANDCSGHPGHVPGPYVMIGVSDDGCGMDSDTLGQIFEPFFTTKPVGQGTGLGLATVYGIVRQNEGLINVYSEPGKGTSFKVYLPRVDGAGQATPATAQAQIVPKGTESILIVEDDDMILDLAQSILSRQGYHVVTAKTPAEAIDWVEKGQVVELLITDVVMPQMNGKQLALRLGSLLPGLKCLFMSGYTANVIAHHGVLEEGVWFIQKPFNLVALANQVRTVLDARG